ncbi:MAG: serine hydrolase [Proteobacteria bacterium]|nr:serine hydrolase [Pseudomonadota bacterium]
MPRPELHPLSQHPATVPWPTSDWSRATHPAQPEIEQALDDLFDLPHPHGTTYAVLIVQQGAVIAERYAAGANPIYFQYSWSMAKSVTHALVGLLVKDGRIDINDRAPVQEWLSNDDPRSAITWDQLLKMRSGLRFNEDYLDGQVSDVIPMLMGDGRFDTGAFAAAMPLDHPPGTFWSYSSGTTNIICRLLRDLTGGPTEMLRFMQERLFEPIGMSSATPRFDNSGTFIGSSFLLATPEDFARFGYLYLRDGCWAGRRLLPEGWVDYARTVSYRDPEYTYGAHWWLAPDSPRFMASGYDGQRILIDPANDLVAVRCGRTAVDHVQPIWDALDRVLTIVTAG